MCISNDDSEIKRVNSYISVKGEHSGGEQEGRAGTGSTVRTQAGCRCAQVHQGVGGDEETEHITLLWWRFGSLHWTLDICQGEGPPVHLYMLLFRHFSISFLASNVTSLASFFFSCWPCHFSPFSCSSCFSWSSDLQSPALEACQHLVPLSQSSSLSLPSHSSSMSRW